MLCRFCIDEGHKEHRERIAAVNKISDFLQDINFKLKADKSLYEAIKGIKSALAESLMEIGQFRTTINNSINLFEEKVRLHFEKIQDDLSRVVEEPQLGEIVRFAISNADTFETACKRIAGDHVKLVTLRNYEQLLHEQTELHTISAKIHHIFAADTLKDFSNEFVAKMASARKYYEHTSSNNKRITFSKQLISVDDFKYLPKTVEEVVFMECVSKEWYQVSQTISQYDGLLRLEMHQCDSGDDLCKGVAASKSLRHLILSMLSIYVVDCCVTDKGVE